MDQPKKRNHKMGDRGVTRPEVIGGEHKNMEPEKSGSRPMDRQKMLQQHHEKTNWIYWTLMLLGLWLLLTPLTFQYSLGAAMPAGGRPVWLSLPLRLTLSAVNDVFCGLLLLYFGYRSIRPNRPISLWAACWIGIWLNAAPLVFWSPSALAYLNDTLVGTLVIALTVLIPGMPNMILFMKMGPEQPPGWSYNPSSWPQRAVLILLGFAGWLVSRYLTAFQLGYLDQVWEPFFGEGSRRVLTSEMSRSWPISDAGLGAFSYTLEFLMGWMGSTSRWRTMPWMVTVFGILVIPLGLTHIILVISQPVTVGYWCSFCLLAACIMLPMIPLEVDEVVAMIQFLRRAKSDGKPLWRTFWKGDTIEGGGPDTRSPGIASFPHQPLQVARASIWGMSFPWTLVAAALLGLWTLFVPAVLGNTQGAAAVDHIFGALVVTTSVISMGEVIRSVRLVNILFGLILAVAPLMLTGATPAGQVNDLIVGLLIIGTALPRGPITESYGKWNRWII